MRCERFGTTVVWGSPSVPSGSPFGSRGRPTGSSADCSPNKAGQTEVYDADLKGYFDSIPHDKLMKAVEQRVVDRSVLHLLRLWLTAPVVDEREGGPPRPSKQGTPQGGVISPLLANIFLHWFDVFFHGHDGPANWAKARLVRYADDFVVLAHRQGPRLCAWVEGVLEGRMGLVVNREKTRIVKLKEKGASFDFLGFTFGWMPDLQGRGHRYLGVRPSEKALARERAALREIVSIRSGCMPLPDLVGGLNRHLKGWANYFDFGYPRHVFRRVNDYVRDRLCRHLKRRSQRRYRVPDGKTLYAHLAELGTVGCGLRFVALAISLARSSHWLSRRMRAKLVCL